MDQVLRTMKTEMTVAFVVALVGGTLTFIVAFLLLSRRQITPPWWVMVALRLLKRSNNTTLIAVEEEGGIVFDCIVCLCEVSWEDEYRKLPNCNHGVQFHAHCIDAWLKNHSTCPMCRSDIPRPLSRRINAYVSQHLLEVVISYCTSALDNVATSIVSC